MVTAIFRNAIGGVESISVMPRQTVADVLRAQGIPTNAVITSVNGRVVSEAIAVIQEGDDVVFQQVRHYDLDVTRYPRGRRYGTAAAPVYTKSIIYDHDGDVEIRSEDFGEPEFVSYIEQVFVESITKSPVFSVGLRGVVGLSGGRDSVAFLKLIERTRNLVGAVDFTMVTVSGIPDWDEPETFGAAKASNARLGFEHLVVGPDAIAQQFRLREPFNKVMTEVIAGQARSLVMVITHHVMRRMIEVQAERLGVRQVYLGLNADDLMSSLVTWFTSGFQMSGIPVRQVGLFTYAFPLYRITKKELTLYLRFVAPELTRQGAPGRFTTGPDERSLAYAVTDHLYTLWPGIDYYAFKAFETMLEYHTPKQEADCHVCGGTYVLQRRIENPHRICDICELFKRMGVSDGM
jgi:tRNA(Ile)-lysidine synthase TilS/MesJ/sulfur carrier protein ThiS